MFEDRKLDLAAPNPTISFKRILDELKVQVLIDE
jgi:hypothetical protein